MADWSKEVEAAYYRKLPASAVEESYAKPFSEPARGELLVEIGIVMSLLPQPPARLVDLGSGTGWTSRFFAWAGYEVLGTDFAPEAVALAAERNVLKQLSFLQHDWDQPLPEELGRFDVAVFFDSLHHSADERAPLRTAFEALRPGGICVTCEPGTGHADAEVSRQASASYGVKERDMPPSAIIAAGLAAGFRSAETYAHPKEIMRNVYAPWEQRSRRDSLLATRPGQLLRVARAITIQKPRWGIVVLTK